MVSVCLGRAQNPPDRDGLSTQISPIEFGAQRRLVSGSTTARVASGIGYPNAPTRSVPVSLARLDDSAPFASTLTSLRTKASLSRSTSDNSVLLLGLATL